MVLADPFTIAVKAILRLPVLANNFIVAIKIIAVPVKPLVLHHFLTITFFLGNTLCMKIYFHDASRYNDSFHNQEN